ncbi:hypothetical protein LJR030_000121 [Rhizobium sp. LjRoot30]|uniref:hypothetical protein n=1 Tax=Rhizobium sp. LjRoot30 TaxID=3342320 RepID=UPI003ECF8431
MRLARFIFALIAGFLLEALVLHLLHAGSGGTAFLPGLAALAAAMAAMWVIAAGRRARYLLLLTALFGYGLFAALVFGSPDIQPVTARLLSSLAAVAFALFGYVRFVSRS